MNFFDTADVYGDGRSERLLAKLKADRKEEIIIATKAGRRLDPHNSAGYNRQNLTAFIERSLKNLNTETLDLVQLHCPPVEVYYRPEVFGWLDDMVKAGKIRYYGVSVEKVEEALKAIEYPGVQTVQIIFNMFRQRPADLFFAEAQRRKVGILARLPLSSGLLAGKMSPSSSFAARRPPGWQPAGRVVRPGRDLLGGRFRDRLTGGGRAAPAGPGRLHAGAIGDALDPDVRGGDLRHTGGEKTVANGRESARSGYATVER